MSLISFICSRTIVHASATRLPRYRYDHTLPLVYTEKWKAFKFLFYTDPIFRVRVAECVEEYMMLEA